MKPLVPPEFDKALVIGSPRTGSSLVAWMCRIDLGLIHRRDRFFNEPFHGDNYDTEMRFNLHKIETIIEEEQPIVVKDHWSHYGEYKSKTGLDFPQSLYKDFYRIRIIRRNFRAMVWSNAIAEEYGIWGEESKTLKNRRNVFIKPENFLDAFEKTIVDINIERVVSTTFLKPHRTIYYEDIWRDANRYYPEILLQKNSHWAKLVTNHYELNLLYKERIREWNLNPTNNWMIRDGKNIVDR